MILALIIILYLLAALVLGCVGIAQGQLMEFVEPTSIRFRKPWTVRLLAGMLGWLFLLSPFLIATGTRPSDLVWAWCILAPIFFPLAALLLFLSGPQEVSLNSETRAFQAAQGWPFYPKKQQGYLAEEAYVAVQTNGYIWYVMLRMGGRRQPAYLLAKPITQSASRAFAQEMANKLHLPVKEMTLQELKKLK